MPEWSPMLPYWLCLLGGIIIGHSLLLYLQFYRKAEGYMLRAARKLWLLFLPFFAIEWLLGAPFLHIGAKFEQNIPIPLWLLACIIGVIAAAAPVYLESLILPSSGMTVEKLQQRLTKLLLKLNIAMRYNFAWAIESCRQQDVFDCQRPNSWGLGINPTECGRRIRKLYEFEKLRIAEKRRDPSLLRYDVGRDPWDKLYLLGKHLGRKRLRENIRNPVQGRWGNWDGRERRRVVGTKADRNQSEDPDPSRSRIYDDEELVRRIAGRRDDSDTPSLQE